MDYDKLLSKNPPRLPPSSKKEKDTVAWLLVEATIVLAGIWVGLSITDILNFIIGK